MQQTTTYHFSEPTESIGYGNVGWRCNEGTDLNRHGYRGLYSEQDPETGLNHFLLRDYDPRLGRWHKTDPYNQFHSPYIGMGNNPVSGVDPDGGIIRYVRGVWGYWSDEPDGEWDGKLSSLIYHWIAIDDGMGDQAKGPTCLVEMNLGGGGGGGAFALPHPQKVPDVPQKTDVPHVGDNKPYKEENNDTYMAGALVLSGALIADDASGFLVVDDIAIPFIVLGALILDNYYNPNLEGTTTSRGNPSDWSFDPEIKRLQNDKLYPPGSKPPKWFWPSIGTAAGYELYNNWPKPKIPQTTQPVDNTFVAPTPILPYPSIDH